MKKTKSYGSLALREVYIERETTELKTDISVRKNYKKIIFVVDIIAFQS